MEADQEEDSQEVTQDPVDHAQDGAGEADTLVTGLMDSQYLSSPTQVDKDSTRWSSGTSCSNPEACLVKWLDEMDYVMPSTPQFQDLHNPSPGRWPLHPSSPMSTSTTPS